MTDSFTEEDQAPFSFDQLREDERELDKQASLVDTRTDIDYREASTLIWRCLLLLRAPSTAGRLAAWTLNPPPC